MNSGVYMIRNRLTKDAYVGSAHKFLPRWNLHRTHLRRGTHHSRYLQHAWNKYGEDYFEFFVLGVYPKEELLAKETEWLTLFKARYNTCRVGRSRAGVRNRPEHNAAIAEKARARWANPEFKARMKEVLRTARNRYLGKC